MRTHLLPVGRSTEAAAWPNYRGPENTPVGDECGPLT